ncbi:MAG: hypothetical protein WC967_03105 [Balneolaceae bacterium]
MNTRTLIFLCAVTLFASCSLFNNDQGKPTGELIPLAVGNYWDYHRWYISPNIADTIREEILSEHLFEIDGVETKVYGYQRYHSSNTHPEINYQWFRMNNEEGSHFAGGFSDADTLIQKNIVYKYPQAVGQVWDYFGISYNFEERTFSIKDTIAIEVISLNDTFETEFGKYKGCYVYRYSEIGKGDGVYHWHHYVYIKPGIGIVAV